MADTARKAQLSFITASKFLLSKGYDVAVPLDYSSSVDLIARRGEFKAWYNLQVKSFYKDKTCMVANLCRTTPSGREHYNADIDAFLLINGDETIFLPHHLIDGRTRIAVTTARELAKEE